MAQDDLDHIPSISATRDTDTRRVAGNNRARSAAGKPAGKGAAPGGRSGAGVWARLFISVALVAGGVACAWAWQLQEQLKQSEATLEGYVKRISDLEDRLSDTDEGLSNNTATMAVKIKELTEKADTNFKEIDKLWASAWRRNKARIDDIEKKSDGNAGKVAAVGKSLTAVEGQLKSAAGDIARLKSVAGDLERLMSSAKANQAEVERVADNLNRINLELSKLGKRVEGNEEWVGSINAFRRQMASAMTDLRADIQALQAAP